MNCSENNKVEIKLIGEQELKENREILIDLLEETLMLNFVDVRDFRKFAKNNYENMVRFNKDNSAILIGAFNKDKIVGLLWAYRREVLGENRIHINHIVVDATVRSRGVGSQMLNLLEDIAIVEGILKIELMATAENDKTVRFYREKGFLEVRLQFEKKIGKKDVNK